MCELMLSELPEQERAELDKAMALLNPYLQIAAVEWMPETKELNA